MWAVPRIVAALHPFKQFPTCPTTPRGLLAAGAFFVCRALIILPSFHPAASALLPFCCCPTPTLVLPLSHCPPRLILLVLLLCCWTCCWFAGCASLCRLVLYTPSMWNFASYVSLIITRVTPVFTCMTLNIVAVLINTISLEKGNPWCEKEEAPSSSSRPSASPARSFRLLLLGLPLKILQHLKAAVAKQKISDSYLGR